MNCDKTFLSIFSLMKSLLKFPTFSVIKLFDGVLYTGRYYKWHSLSFLISLYGAVTHLSTSTNTSLASTLSSQHLCLAPSASSRVSWPPLLQNPNTLGLGTIFTMRRTCAGLLQGAYPSPRTSPSSLRNWIHFQKQVQSRDRKVYEVWND